MASQRDPLAPTQRYNLTFEEPEDVAQPDGDAENSGTSPAKQQKPRNTRPWEVVGSFAGPDAYEQAKAQLKEHGELQQGQRYGSTVRVEDYRCALYYLHDCKFEARIKLNTATGHATLWTLHSHDHSEDLTARGLKRAAKEFLEPFVGLRCAKPKTLYNQLVTESGIPKEDLPTLEVSYY